MKMFKKILFTTSLVLVSSLGASHAWAEETQTSSKEGSKVKITGDFCIRALYDIAGQREGSQDFAPSLIPSSYDENVKRRQFVYDVPGAALGIESSYPLMGSPVKFGLKGGLDAEAASLKSVYIDHKWFLMGLTTSNFCDCDTFPSLLTDAPCSGAAATVVQAGFKHQLTKEISYHVAVENPQTIELYPESSEKEKAETKTPALITNQNIPALTASAKYDREDTFYVRGAGILRMFDYYKRAKEEDIYLTCWGANLSAVVNIIPKKTSLKLFGLFGSGIGSYLVDFAGIKNDHKDVYFTDKAKAELGTIDTRGGHVAVEHCWTPKISSTVTYGILDTTDDEKRGKDTYRQGHFAAGGLSYKPIDQLTVGVEYLYGMRFGIGAEESKDAHRVQAAVCFEL